MSEGKGGNHRKFGQLRNIANIGDIILIAGYGALEFRVESWTHELDHQPDYVAEVILYDVTDLLTGQYLLTYQEDVSVIRRAGEGGNSSKGTNASSLDMDYGFPILGAGWEWFGGMDFGREEEAPVKRPKGMSKEERIDRLLMEISDYKTLIRMPGDDANDEYYLAKIDEAKNRLRELTGGAKE